MRNFTYDELAVDPAKRKIFLDAYAELIKACKKYGFTEAAKAHARNRKRLADDLALIDEEF
ncbi:hypothetical protein [Neorhizobium sp. JUb45]|uniref:hypothetical protein n=1 Tax=Neorhizobium sp. JUb45 TaxID=2485113 RepID=UPI00104758BB|nr:hypothetical protein [Neorhizobium sp. JUb45]